MATEIIWPSNGRTASRKTVEDIFLIDPVLNPRDMFKKSTTTQNALQIEGNYLSDFLN